MKWRRGYWLTGIGDEAEGQWWERQGWLITSSCGRRDPVVMKHSVLFTLSLSVPCRYYKIPATTGKLSKGYMGSVSFAKLSYESTIISQVYLLKKKSMTIIFVIQLLPEVEL